MRAILVAVVTSAAACAPSARVLSAPIARGAAATEAGPRQEAERLWAERSDPVKLRTAIAAWKRAVATRDEDARAWADLAHAEFFLADGFLQFDPAARPELVQTFEDGAAHAERGLRALAADFETRRHAGSDVDQAAAGLEATADPRLLAELLYWWGENIIRWSDLEGWRASMGVYKTVSRVMERVAALDPTVDHAGPDRYLGAFYAEAPSIAGGDLGKSKMFFAKAIAREPAYLETRVAYARYFAKRSGDKALYAETLKLIAATPADTIPGAEPEQLVARQKAARLPPAL